MTCVNTQIVRLSPFDATQWLSAALDIYVTAMEYPSGIQAQRLHVWREHLNHPGWRGVGALDASNTLVGVAYGYNGASNQWWNQQLRKGLTQRGASSDYIAAVSSNYFELTELHVHPAAQGRGIGHALLSALLRDVTMPQVLLSTPEVPAENNRAWHLYRRVGFADVLRHFRFVGDAREFAVLGRQLPL